MTEMTEITDLIKLVEELEKPQIRVFDKRGRGKKQCPKCQRIIGVRNTVCICKHKFLKKVEIQEVNSPECIEARNFVNALGYCPLGMTVLFTPEGKCPIKFKGDIGDWADKLIERYYGANYVLAPEALQYMMGHLTAMNSDEYHSNKLELAEWIKGIKNEYSTF
jgi:hypothetical protein